MDSTTEILELKFEGNNIKPSKVKASEIANLISAFEDAITAIVRQVDPTQGENEVLISFDEIKNESISIKNLVHDSKNIVIPAYLTLVTAFNTSNFSQLPFKTIESLKYFTRFAKKHGCEGSLRHKGIANSHFRGDTEIKVDESRYISGDTTIYGILQRVGGADPRITLLVDNKYSLTFDVKKDIAVQLGTKLYKEIALHGTAKWDRTNYTVQDFKAERVLDFEAMPINQSFEELSKIVGKHINDLDNINSFLADA